MLPYTMYIIVQTLQAYVGGFFYILINFLMAQSIINKTFYRTIARSSYSILFTEKFSGCTLGKKFINWTLPNVISLFVYFLHWLCQSYQIFCRKSPIMDQKVPNFPKKAPWCQRKSPIWWFLICKISGIFESVYLTFCNF